MSVSETASDSKAKAAVRRETPRFPGRLGQRAGFSMIELMVIIGILAVAATAVIPNMIGWRGAKSLQTAINELRGDLFMMKTLAVRDNTTVSATFDRPAGAYTISANGRDLKTARLPAGVGLNTGGAETFTVSFNSRGGANSSTIRLAAPGGMTKSITISPLGKITVRD
jgi:type IV fimbrial biogenesis protein FimT